MLVLLQNLNKNIKFIKHIKLIIIFGILYWLGGIIETKYKIEPIEKNKYINKMNLFDSLYFSLVTQTTVGYGNVFPRTRLSQIINIIQLICILVVYL